MYSTTGATGRNFGDQLQVDMVRPKASLINLEQSSMFFGEFV